jgi:hypothetical protein
MEERTMARRPGWFSPLFDALRSIREKSSSSRSTRLPLTATPAQAALPSPLQRVARSELQATLDSIVYDVVDALGYVVGMVAT